MNANKRIGLWFLAAGFAAPAFADPCEAKLPSRLGDTFSGEVRYVGDGDSLCVGKTTDPNEWIEVRIEDFDAPEISGPQGPAAKKVLEQVSLGKQASCTVMRGRNGKTASFDRVIAKCIVGGVSIGDLMRQANAPTSR
jgi:endonuclease YncB( thermonuclease family)